MPKGLARMKKAVLQEECRQRGLAIEDPGNKQLPREGLILAIKEFEERQKELLEAREVIEVDSLSSSSQSSALPGESRKQSSSRMHHPQ